MTRGRRWKRAKHGEQQGGVAGAVGSVCVRDRQTDRDTERPQTDTEREGGEEAGKYRELGGEARKEDWGSDLGGLHPPSQGTQASPLGSEEITQRVKRCVLESEF